MGALTWTHVCVWVMAVILILSNYIFYDFLKGALYSNQNSLDMAYIFPLLCLLPVFLHLLFLFIFCLSFKTNFKCYAFHEVPHCLNYSFFLLIPISHLYFSSEYHTMSCIICILFLLCYKLFKNMDFLCKVFSFFLY